MADLTLGDYVANFDIWVLLGIIGFLAKRSFTSVEDKIKSLEEAHEELRAELKNGISTRMFELDREVGRLGARCDERHRGDI